MTVANGLLAPSVGRNALDGQIDFDQALGILWRHLFSGVPSASQHREWLAAEPDSVRFSRWAANRVVQGLEPR